MPYAVTRGLEAPKVGQQVMNCKQLLPQTKPAEECCRRMVLQHARHILAGARMVYWKSKGNISSRSCNDLLLGFGNIVNFVKRIWQLTQDLFQLLWPGRGLQHRALAGPKPEQPSYKLGPSAVFLSPRTVVES